MAKRARKPNAPRGRGVAAEVVLEPVVSVSAAIVAPATDPRQEIPLRCELCWFPGEWLAVELAGKPTVRCPSCGWVIDVPIRFWGPPELRGEVPS